MNNFKRGFVNLITAISFIFTPVMLNAGYVGTPDPTDDPSIIAASCTESTLTEYDPIGDTRGNSVLTKQKSFRDCNITKRVEGECIKWEEDVSVAGLGKAQFDSYDTRSYGDSLGQLMAMLGAYDQMEHLWSGFKGYCIEGTLQDFDWASDPMFWASMALSYFMSSGEEGGAMDSLMDEGSKIAKEAGITISKASLTCMATAAAGAMVATYDYLKDDENSNDDCDPVDEICATGEEGTEESEIMTMDKVQFDDLVDQASKDGNNTDLYDYIVIIGENPDPATDIVTFRIKHTNEIPGANEFDQAQMQELKDQMKEMSLYISLGMTAANLGACMVSDGTLGNNIYGGAPSSDDRASLRNGANAGIDFATKFMGPAGPIIGIALKLLTQIALSFSDVDTCNNEEDAKEQGSRHEKTYKSLSVDLCHAVGDRCVDEWIVIGGCCLTGYDYCCYDQVLTKILVEQIKAQLPRDWAHCSGISLSDLNHISFKQCTDSQMDTSTNGGFIDGAHGYVSSPDPDNPIPGPGYDMFNAFQYEFHCIDMTEFKDYLKDLIGEEIDMDNFEDYWNDLTRQPAT